MTLKIVSELVMPDFVLDKTYMVRCECGYARDCGYMGITADRLADTHRERGRDHDVTVEVSEAPVLTRKIMSGRRWGSIKTLRRL